MAVQGYVYTFGLELCLAVDIVVAAEDAQFAQLEPKRGLGVLAGGNFRLIERAGWGNAMYHLLRADEFSAQRALELGVVQEVVPVDEQGTRAQELAEEICQCAPLAVQWVKKSSIEYLKAIEDAAIALIPDMRQETSKSEDAALALKSFKDKTLPQFTGR